MAVLSAGPAVAAFSYLGGPAAEVSWYPACLVAVASSYQVYPAAGASLCLAVLVVAAFSYRADPVVAVSSCLAACLSEQCLARRAAGILISIVQPSCAPASSAGSIALAGFAGDRRKWIGLQVELVDLQPDGVPVTSPRFVADRFD
jgi:hypothetical protein